MREMPLTRGMVALIDDEDFPIVSLFKWRADKYHGGFRAVTSVYIDSKKEIITLFMHRLIMNAPKGVEVDHREHNTLDNRKHKLRLCTRSQNCMNATAKGGSSKFKGVYWSNQKKRWHAEIYLNLKKIHIGFFKCEIEAAKSYNEKAKTLFGEFVLLNNVQSHRLHTSNENLK